MKNKNRLVLCLLLLILNVTGFITASTLVSPITNYPDPFGPLPASTTNTFWIQQSSFTDYVNMVYDKNNVIKRRLANRPTAGVAGTGPVKCTNIWNGQDDFGGNCTPDTYKSKVKVSRIATSEVLIPSMTEKLPCFERIKDMATDKFGNVYVLDALANTVQKFDSEGTLLWRYGFETDPNPGGMYLNPDFVGGLTVDTNSSALGPYFYIIDQSGRTRISRYDQNGRFIAQLTPFDNADDNPTGVGYSQKYNRLFTAAMSSDDVLGVNLNTTMGNWFQNNAAGFTNLTDIQPTDGTSTNNSYIFGINQTNLYRWSVASGVPNSFPDATRPLTNKGVGVGESRSITCRSNKYLYIVGTGNRGHFIRCVTTNGVVIETRGSKGTGNTNFWAPQGVTWDPVNDRIWVADTSNQRLVCYDVISNKLRFRKKVENSSSPYLIVNPLDVAIDRYGSVYVVDNGKCVLKKFDEYGNFKMQIGGRGSGPGLFTDPKGVAVDENGYIYISDYGTIDGNDATDGIQKFDADGNYLLSIDVPDPRGLTSFVRNNSNFIVACCQTNNAANGRELGFRVFDPSGNLLRLFSANDNGHDYTDVEVDHLYNYYAVDVRGADTVDYYPNSTARVIAEVNLAVAGARAGIAIDPYGTMWVPNKATSVIDALTAYSVLSSMPLLYQFGSIGSAEGEMQNPNYCSIRMREIPGHWADLWVVDSGNSRLQKFIINWSSELDEPMTIVSPGAPKVNQAYPVPSLSTNATFVDSYYVREGVATFKIVFSKTMNTNAHPVVQYVTADSFSFPISETSYLGNVWIGTARINTGHDGNASIRVTDAAAGSTNIDPNPSLVQDCFIIDTTPPTVSLYRPTEDSVTAYTNILVDGDTEPFSKVDLFNYTTRDGAVVAYRKTNVIADYFGYFMFNNMPLQPKESSNFITVRAKDSAGNIGMEYSPRRKVRSVYAIGSAYVTPTTNRRLGDAGDSPIDFIWTADADMSLLTITGDIPRGWSEPNTNKAAAGYLRIQGTSKMVLNPSKPLLTGNPAYPNRFKINVDSVTNGGWIRLRYGTNGRTMVSNSLTVALGQNEWVARATNNITSYTTEWVLPKKVVETVTKSLKIPVVGKPMRVILSNSMPSVTYKGASGVPAMRLFFVNSNRYHTAKINSVLVDAEDSFFNTVNANTRISSLFAYTNNVLLSGPFAAMSSPLLSIDLSAGNFLVKPGKTNRVDIRMNMQSITSFTDIRFGIQAQNNITAIVASNNLGTVLNNSGSFPLLTTHAVIRSNQQGVRFITRGSNTAPLYGEAATTITPLRIILASTNTNVNDVELLRIYVQSQLGDSSPAVPNTLFDRITIRKANGGTVYGQKVPESSGNSMAVDITGLYIPQRTSFTLEVQVALRTNFPQPDFRLLLSTSTNIKARDRILFTPMTNLAPAGYAFPFSTSVIPVLSRFRIMHDTSGDAGIWEPVRFRMETSGGQAITNFTGTVTLDTVTGRTDVIFWTNNHADNGSFLDLGLTSDRARYTFALADRGVVTLSIKDYFSETLSVRARSGQGGLVGLSNNLIINPDPDPPSAPTLVSLLSNVQSNVMNPLLVWNHAIDVRTAVRSYLVQLSSNGFSTVQRTNSVLGEYGTNWVVSPGLPDGSWSWRVASRDWGGNLSSYTTAWIFTVDAVPDLNISKRAYITNSVSYVSLGGGVHDFVPGALVIYTVKYTNYSLAIASNILVRDIIPSNLRYKSNSIVLNGTNQSDAWDGDKTDYGVTLPNSLTSTLKRVAPRTGGKIVYRVLVR